MIDQKITSAVLSPADARRRMFRAEMPKELRQDILRERQINGPKKGFRTGVGY